MVFDKYTYVLKRFFSKSKKRDFLRLFELLYTFSVTLARPGPLD